MNKGFFVTGTDTEVGKTYVTCLLLKALAAAGATCAGFKPVAAGCEKTAEGLRNQDALELQQATSVHLPYALVNPIAFARPVAPHLAAAQLGQRIDMAKIEQGYRALQAQMAGIILVEGAGGWRLPLGHGQFLSDFVRRQNMPVILVVGMRLGCLNHALLTAEAIRADGLPIAGWVANQIDPAMALAADNLVSLQQLLAEPFLGYVPHAGAQQDVANPTGLNVQALLG